MDRRDFVKAAAVAPLAGLPLIDGSGIPIEKASNELTEEEKAQLWEKYKNLVHFCAWKLKHDPYIYGGVINPEDHLVGKQGEWVTFEFQGKKISSPHDELVESFRDQIFTAAEWWKNKQLGSFDSPGFKVFIKETIWRYQKECIENYTEGIDYPDGPWAEGWEQRCSLNPKGLPVMEFEKDGMRPSVHKVEEIFRDVPWVPTEGATQPQCHKKALVYVRQEDAVGDFGDAIAWGEMDLYLLEHGWFTINANTNSYRQSFNRRSTFSEDLRREKT
jgi:hypothetical protein